MLFFAHLSGVNLNSNVSSPRKCSRSSEIIKSEKMVSSISKVLKDDFINPLCPELEKDQLYNFASGCPLAEDAANNLLSVQENGADLRAQFYKRLNSDNDVKDLYFDRIKRVPWKSFTDTHKKVKVSGKTKSKEVTVQFLVS